MKLWVKNFSVNHRFFSLIVWTTYTTSVSGIDSSLEYSSIHKVWILDVIDSDMESEHETGSAIEDFMGVSGVTTECNTISVSEIIELILGWPK